MPSKAYRALRIVGLADAALFLLVGLAELVLADDPFGHRILFAAVLALLAALVVIGVQLVPARPWPGLLMASAGAIPGGVALFWTGLAILLAVAIVVLGAICALRVRRAATQPA